MIIEICPICNNVGFPVKNETVISLSKKQFTAPIESKLCACLEKSCSVAYFCANEYILKEDLKVPLWYKNDDSDVPICYCSDIKRKEIKIAVEHGCKSIDDVQEYLRKDSTGKCKNENPLGLCCRNIFLNEIEKQIKTKISGEVKE